MALYTYQENNETPAQTLRRIQRYNPGDPERVVVTIQNTIDQTKGLKDKEHVAAYKHYVEVLRLAIIAQGQIIKLVTDSLTY